MQINRLFGIVHLLMDQKRLTAQQLADHFEVSKRTILRDIDALCAAHIPLYTTQGKGGGISLMEGFVLNKAALTQDEQQQILLGLQSLSATQHAEAGDILQKLTALFQQQTVAWIEVDFSRWGQGGGDNARFALIRQAILGSRVLAFEYVGTTGEHSHRTVCPLKLVFKSKAWYLQGFCLDREDYRTFRLNRMLQVMETERWFERGAYTPPPIEAANADVASLVTVELVFVPDVAYRVYDEFEEGAIDRAEDGTLHVSARLPEDNWLYGFLLSFGQEVQVLQPQHVRDRLLQKRHLT